MSGPKDFSVDVSDILLTMLAGRRMQQEAAFSARVQALRLAPRRRPAPRAAVETPAMQSVAMESGTDAKAEHERETAAARATEARAVAAAEAAKEAARVAAEFAEIRDAIDARRDALAEDDVLCTACGDRFRVWNERCERVGGMEPDAAAVREAREVLAEADSLVQHALDVSQQLEKRRHVLQAMIESFHAIGYFTDVTAPESAEEPARPVTVVARRGTEEVAVALPLGEAPVQSVWNGQAGERCVDSFLLYVEQMGKRDITCRPARTDLAPRPQLKQMGRKELPGAQSQGRPST
jgi:hypothetical protein